MKQARTYALLCNWMHSAIDFNGLARYIADSRLFDAWWNYIPYVFLVESNLNPTDIARVLSPYTKDAFLLVVEINPASADGLLPKEAWDWIRDRVQRRLDLDMLMNVQPNALPG